VREIWPCSNVFVEFGEDMECSMFRNFSKMMRFIKCSMENGDLFA
jgi:hypothetical protein